MRRLLLGLVFGAIIASAGTAGAAWVTTQVEGEVGGKLASLSPVELQVAPFDGVYPGQMVALKGSLTNGNPVPLRVTDVTVTDFSSSEGDACAKGNFLQQIEGETFAPGATEDVLIARLDVPDSLLSRCQGAELTIKFSVTTAYGS
jgi:hypothetical protein